MRVLGLIAEGALVGEASVDLVHEVVFVRARQLQDRRQAVALGREITEACILHDVERRDLLGALELFGAHPRLDFRDAVYAATAINRGIERIISTDRDFDDVSQLQRIDPADKGALAELIA